MKHILNYLVNPHNILCQAIGKPVSDSDCANMVGQAHPPPNSTSPPDPDSTPAPASSLLLLLPGRRGPWSHQLHPDGDTLRREDVRRLAFSSSSSSPPPSKCHILISSQVCLYSSGGKHKWSVFKQSRPVGIWPARRSLDSRHQHYFCWKRKNSKTLKRGNFRNYQHICLMFKSLKFPWPRPKSVDVREKFSPI